MQIKKQNVINPDKQQNIINANNRRNHTNHIPIIYYPEPLHD